MNPISTYYSTVFNLIRLVDGRLVSSECKIGMEFELIAGQEVKKQTQAMKCIKRWIDTALDQSIVFDIQTTINTQLIEELSNNIILTPGEPHDHLLLMLFFAKCNAIGRGHVEILTMNLESSSSQGFSYTYAGDLSDALPTVDQWLGEYRYYDQCWWHRHDGSTFEVLAESTDDLNDKPDILVDLWAEPTEQKEPATIIKLNKTNLKVLANDTDTKQ